MGKTDKKTPKNHATKVTKIQKTKRQKYGMNETIITKKKIETYMKHNWTKVVIQS